jgi:excisionase family DNA binding protein
MSKITADHLARRACVYIRQSTPDQVRHNLESQRRQYALVDHARTLGWVDIDVIDEDLGISGSGGARRPGFERLLRALCDGQVGAVFSIEASRLARNGRDWHTLLEFCCVVGALLIDAEAVYDPRLTNDRLLLGMKGTISEMEVANFRERGQTALRQKAQRGALIQRVAIGYVKRQDDRLEKDPDAQIRSTIELIFRKFAELGSVRQVYFWLDRERIQLPVALGSKDAREVVWQAARYHAVLSILKNPVYAGAYAYGRSKSMTHLEAGQKVQRQVRRRREHWSVLILDHHEGYIDWDVYQRNQEMIADNNNARSNAVRGAVQHGEALLAGLLRCGHCGAKLLTQYPRPHVIRYQCSGHILNRDQAYCVLFGGLRADRLVSEQLLQCMTPLGIDAAMEAIATLEDASDERIQQKTLALERARYEVTHARRQYDAVDPANRLVAAELERRWNRALSAEAQLESELKLLEESRESPITDVQKRELLDFSRDLPRLWDDLRSSPEYKKRLLRIALKEITATSDGESIRLVLHWQGGDHTQVEFPKIRTGRHRYVTDDDLVETIRKLARIEPDTRIASILNRNQRLTAHGQEWTARRVCSLRNNHAIPVYREGERQARDEMSVSEVADLLNVTPTTIFRLIRLKQLPATQACSNAPWSLCRSDVERYLTERSCAATPPTVDSAQLPLEIP